MNNFLEKVNFISNKISNLIDTYILKDLFITLAVISFISFFIFDNISISVWCIGFLLMKNFIKSRESKITERRLKCFDEKTPGLLDMVINEAIKQYEIYRFIGTPLDKLNISEKLEIEMNHEVCDIVLSRLENSVIFDKFKLYYGDMFEEILVCQINMAVATRVIQINNDYNTSVSAKSTRIDSQQQKIDTSKYLKEMGF